MQHTIFNQLFDKVSEIGCELAMEKGGDQLSWSFSIETPGRS